MNHIGPWLALCLSAAPLAAQSAEFAVTGGVSRLSNRNLGSFSDRGNVLRVGLTDGWRLGFRTTLNNWRFFGHEFGYAYNRTQLQFNEDKASEQGMAIHQGFYNFLGYAIPEGLRVRPFVTGGVHFSNFTPPGTSATSGGGSVKFGLNYGGGIKIRISNILAIRFDFRQYLTPKPFDLRDKGPWLRQLEVGTGLALVL